MELFRKLDTANRFSKNNSKEKKRKISALRDKLGINKNVSDADISSMSGSIAQASYNAVGVIEGEHSLLEGNIAENLVSALSEGGSKGDIKSSSGGGSNNTKDDDAKTNVKLDVAMRKALAYHNQDNNMLNKKISELQKHYVAKIFKNHV